MTLYKNIGSKKLPKFEFVTDDFLHLRQISKLYGIKRLLPTFGDVDADGDMDVFFTSSNGSWHVGINKPIASEMHLDTFIFNVQGLDNFRNGSMLLAKINKDSLLDIVVGFDAPAPYYFPNIGSAQQYEYSYDLTKKNISFGNCSISDSAQGLFYLHPVIQIANTDNSSKRYLYAGTSQGNVSQFEINEDSLFRGSFMKIKDNVLPYNAGPEAGLAIGDINDDGMMEFFVGNIRGGLSLYTMGEIDNAVIDSAVGAAINEILEENLNIEIYPNPANEKLFVKSESVRFNQVEIVDMTGRMIIQVSINAIDAEINMSELKSGMYVLKLYSEGKIVQKIVIKE
jgi:hypothetical protein